MFELGATSLSDWPWSWIVLAILGGFFVLVFVALPLAILGAALLEKHHVRPLAPVDAGEVSTAGSELVVDVRNCGLVSLGDFSDGDPGWKRGIITLLHSGDHQILFWILRSRMSGRHKLMTRLVDGRWLVTTNVSGMADLSGLILEEMLPGVRFEVLLAYHRERIASASVDTVPVPAARVVAELEDLARTQATRMSEAGLVSYVAGDRNAYRYTLRGAIGIVVGYLGSTLQTKGRANLAERKQADFYAPFLQDGIGKTKGKS